MSALLPVSHSNSDTDIVSALSSVVLLLGRGGPKRAKDFLRGVMPSCSRGSWVGLEVPMVKGWAAGSADTAAYDKQFLLCFIIFLWPVAAAVVKDHSTV